MVGVPAFVLAGRLLSQVGKVFFAHYEPRFRDNERRVAEQKPVRGGPVGGSLAPEPRHA